mmetsp:Transcript_88321/g.227756  ORF Transcript_88321/g.227756 Transcript_88321/m.227756 type:complete len:102 (-) Transcript_88321:204-509(-)
MFTNLTQHTLYLCWRKQHALSASSHAAKFGPAYLVATATSLIMVHPTYLVLAIAKQVQAVKQPWFHVMHGCTLAGYALLLGGTLWATDVAGKLARASSQGL